MGTLDLEVLPFRQGFIIGKRALTGEIECVVTKTYVSRERALKALERGSFIKRGYCDLTCRNCDYHFNYKDWYISGATDLIFIIKPSRYTFYGRLALLGKIEIKVSINTYGNLIYKVTQNNTLTEYKLIQSERDKVLTWVHQLQNVLDVSAIEEAK